MAQSSLGGRSRPCEVHMGVMVSHECMRGVFHSHHQDWQFCSKGRGGRSGSYFGCPFLGLWPHGMFTHYSSQTPHEGI